jgi:hypothetical protein
MGVRDGVPLPGRTPAEVVSQLTHRIFGPLRLDRVRVVLDYHGLAGSPAAGRPEIAARYRITPPTVGNRVAKVRAAGSRLPLHPGIVDQATRASCVGDDHLGRVRIAATLHLPLPAAAPLPAAPPVLPAPPVASGRAAARLLAAVGPTDIATLVAAVNRSRSYRRGALIAADALSAALTAVGAVPGIDGTWSPPPGMVAPDRYRVIVATAGRRELTRHQMVQVLTAAGYGPASASGPLSAAHPLFHRTGPDRYRIIGQP